jgi:hypothetical protein
MKKVAIPESALERVKPEADNSKVAKETISSTPNSGKVMEAHPTVDAGHDSGCGHWMGDGQDVSFHKA